MLLRYCAAWPPSGTARRPTAHPPSMKNSARRAEHALALRGFELAPEVFQLVGAEIAHRPEREARLGPAADVEALQGFDCGAVPLGALRDEQIDDVHAAPVDQRGDGLAVEIVEPAADQREALRGQVNQRRRDIKTSVEPRLHGV